MRDLAAVHSRGLLVFSDEESSIRGRYDEPSDLNGKEARETSESDGPDARVLAMVRAAIIANPRVKNAELLKRAKEIAPAAMEGLEPRQFHARYRLAVSRERARKNGTIRTRRPRAAKPAAGRTRGEPRRQAVLGNERRIRSILIDFAQEIAGAESRADLIKVMANVDKWAAKIMKGKVEESNA